MKTVGLKSMMKHYWGLYLFVLPSVLLVATFSYYPALNALYHAFYRWNGENISTYVGMENLNQILGIPWLWTVALLIFAAILYTSTAKSRKSDIARIFSSTILPAVCAFILFRKGLALVPDKALVLHLPGLLIPIVIMAVFLVLVSNESPNKWLYLLIPFLFFLVSLAEDMGLTTVFSWSVVFGLCGIGLWTLPVMRRLETAETGRTGHAFFSVLIALWALAKHAGGDPILWGGFSVIFVLVLFNIVKMAPSIITAVVIHRLKNERMNYLYRVLFVVPMIIPGMVYLLIWKFFFNPNEGIFNKILIYTKMMDFLIFLDGRLQWGGIFKEGIMPVWLGDEKLVLPALILWGFPWVGVVGVLIYLAGLQNIDTSIYEAADLDGASPIQKFIHIEFPLILTQVRINLVLMVIGTMQAYGHILILFGIDGGPNGKLMIPGLFMFRSAFQEEKAGYACAIGLVIFFFILALTEINNRYVKVEK